MFKTIKCMSHNCLDLMFSKKCKNIYVLCAVRQIIFVSVLQTLDSHICSQHRCLPFSVFGNAAVRKGSIEGVT